MAQVKPLDTNPMHPFSLAGRWDLTVDENGHQAASWLEVEVSGVETLVGRFVASGGSARPISEIRFDKGAFDFSIPPQWESSGNNLTLKGHLFKDHIEGEIVYPNGSHHSFKGVRAPSLKESKKIAWGKKIRLFNGKDLEGWHISGTKNQWIVKDGVLISPHSGANLISNEKFGDFKLHVEFKYSKGSNSGVYLRGRYEVQIIDNPATIEPNSHLFGGLYGFLPPSEMPVKGPDQWQSYDITLIGRMLTVVANGKMIICNREIPGITGGALDSDEGAPGPIYFQGDHGPIMFRNITITPAK
ncbi:DUF1080 domain-containing protein [Arachidicoccus ginsenosidivorans]|jgi:hypothetical protein|uniref:DUF1080 domain-containing protein n=1 Tax=Arachidicoccus ginsenosidivorans TaxID=496057 RepID=A0A5B8VN16_9BACT|nr:DUF1080 domain-containing protein [Arachidicoccus ginsenosidivorans]QEC72016.1 DUF1080 domain-containing protein [Arachidicoccus ginsenosidivorans]